MSLRLRVVLVLSFVFLFTLQGISYGEVVMKQDIMGKEYRIETVEGEPGNYWVYFGEEKIKWVPKPWHVKGLKEQGPAYYDTWANWKGTEIEFWPYKLSMEKRLELDAKTMYDVTYTQIIPGYSLDYGDDFIAELYSPDLYKRIKKGYELVKYWRFSLDYPENEVYKKYMFFFNYPEDLSGLGFLQIQFHGLNKEDDNFMYLPTVRKVRRLATANRQDYIAGTTFRQEDNALTKPIHNYKYLGTGLVKDLGSKEWGTLGVPEDPGEIHVKPDYPGIDGVGEPAWILETTPYREDWWFARRISYVGMKTLWYHYVDSFDKAGRLIHRFGIRMGVHERGEGKVPYLHWNAGWVKDYKSGYATTFYPEEYVFDSGIPADIFAQRTLTLEPRTLFFWR